MLVEGTYRLDFQIYNVFSSLNSSWLPPSFLSDNLRRPYATDNIEASSSLNLIFNGLFSVDSVYPNDDPLFLTKPEPDIVDNATSVQL